MHSSNMLCPRLPKAWQWQYQTKQGLLGLSFALVPPSWLQVDAQATQVTMAVDHQSRLTTCHQDKDRRLKTVHSQSTDSSVQQHGSETANPASQSTNCYFGSFSHHQHQRQIVMNFSGNPQHSSLAMAIGYPLVQGVERCGLKNGWETGKQPISPACLRNGAKPLVTSRSPRDSSSQQPRTTPTGGFQPKLSASMAFMTAVR